MKREPEKLRRAVVTACQALLFGSDLDRHKPEDRYILRSALNELVWKFSEAHPRPGKYAGCRFWSKAARNAYNSNRSGYTKLVHLEHVVPRKSIIDELLSTYCPSDLRRILDSAETCVILREEHKKLRPGSGWERYADIDLDESPHESDG